jgi:hypothetical protein
MSELITPDPNDQSGAQIMDRGAGTTPPSGTGGRDYDRDRKRLQQFVGDVQGFLRDIVDQGLLPPALHQDQRAAWEELQPMFSSAKTGIDAATDQELENASLAGAQLTFKLAVVGFALKPVKEYVEDLKAGGPKAAGMVAKLFSPLAKVANAILGSMKSIPILGIPADAIGEFKDAAIAGAEAGAAIEEATRPGPGPQPGA